MKTPPSSASSGIRRGLISLAKRHREVVALYLFGSRATGKAGPLSDVDVAVLVDESRCPARSFFRFQLALIAETASACGRKDVDVVLLNEATPLLAYEVTKNGRLLFERDHSARVSFEARSVQRYLDLAPFYRVGRSYLRRQILSGRHG